MSISTRRLRKGAAALAILIPLSAQPALAGDVEITVRNVRAVGGHVMVALYADEAAYLAGRSPRTRAFLERQVLPYDTAFEQVVFAHGGLQPTEAELAQCHALYREVQDRAKTKLEELYARLQ